MPHICGLIAEYNPFHNGHLYHLREAKRLTGADYTVAVMSGDFTQRGLPAVVDKYRRARMALEAGVDLVLELPVYYATGSAEVFAAGAVSLLESLGCVTDLVYGCESGDAAPLRALAKIFASEPGEYSVFLKNELKTGKNYPAAREAALRKYLLLHPESFPEEAFSDAAGLLSFPNNILGIEYEKALISLGSSIKSLGIPRNDSGHYASGEMLRKALAAGDRSALSDQLPESSLPLLDYTADFSDFLPLIRYRLLSLSEEELCGYADVTAELAARLKKNISDPLSAVSKNYTRARLTRALIHILLDIKKAPDTSYIRVLGFRRGSDILRLIKDSRLDGGPVCVTKLSDAPDEFWSEDSFAASVYNQIISEKYGLTLPDEYRAGVVMV